MANAKKEIEKIVHTLAYFADIAMNFQLKQKIISEIQNKLNAVYKENKALLQ